jgi:hypothetical protein
MQERLLESVLGTEMKFPVCHEKYSSESALMLIKNILVLSHSQGAHLVIPMTQVKARRPPREAMGYMDSPV